MFLDNWCSFHAYGRKLNCVYVFCCRFNTLVFLMRWLNFNTRMFGTPFVMVIVLCGGYDVMCNILSIPRLKSRLLTQVRWSSRSRSFRGSACSCVSGTEGLNHRLDLTEDRVQLRLLHDYLEVVGRSALRNSCSTAAAVYQRTDGPGHLDMDCEGLGCPFQLATNGRVGQCSTNLHGGRPCV
ncbi:hypothetical protein TNCT_366671 [Trichonephila clavata]|uniref:Uncharacterized protein n=1 Tax=Trichonephila clavata TaxID=2740835 RepID=A0A8X6I1Z0_TRICU|nr:hypothetical protein TNCT_366671 [Trichonephila clavata]